MFDSVSRNYRVEQAGDIFSEAGQKDEASFNPAQAVPIVVVNNTKILADPCTLVKHLCRHFQMESLYPISSSKQAERQKIDQMLQVCFLHFKRCSDRLVKLVIQLRAVAAGKLDLSDAQKAEKEQALAYEKDAVFSAMMRTVDAWLNESETRYLVQEKACVADLAIYQQLKQVCTFSEL